MAETQTDLAKYQTDHDLLVTLNEQVKQLTIAVTKKNDDHEARIRVLEITSNGQVSSARTWRFALTTALTVLGVAVGIIGLILSHAV